MWPVRFTEAARAELIEAQDWYEAEVPGLGGRFRGEIDSVVGRMADNPRQFPAVFKTLRRGAREEIPLRALFPRRARCPPGRRLLSQQPRPPPLAKTLVKSLWFDSSAILSASSLFVSFVEIRRYLPF